MFPPETMQAIFPPPARPDSATAGASAPGPLGDHPHPLGEQPDRAGGLVQRAS